MPCSHCKAEGHNKKTCPVLKELQVQQELFEKELLQQELAQKEELKKKQIEQSLFIQQQILEYEEAEKADLERQKQEAISAKLAEPSLNDLRELRLQHFMK
jgi:hypothetical protein